MFEEDVQYYENKELLEEQIEAIRVANILSVLNNPSLRELLSDEEVQRACEAVKLYVVNNTLTVIKNENSEFRSK